MSKNLNIDTNKVTKGIAGEVDDNIDLVELYNQGYKDEAISKFYNNNAALIYTTAKKFVSIEDCDKESFALESIDKALKTDSDNNAKLTTYFVKIYKNKLKDILKKQGREKRKINREAVSIEEMLEKETLEQGLSYTMDGTFTSEVEDREVYYDMSELGLSPQQREILKVFVENEGNITQKEVGKVLGISRSTVATQLGRIKNKNEDKVRKFVYALYK